MLHLLVDGPVGEAAPADADALQHAVARQLMQHQSAEDVNESISGKKDMFGHFLVVVLLIVNRPTRSKISCMYRVIVLEALVFVCALPQNQCF